MRWFLLLTVAPVVFASDEVSLHDCSVTARRMSVNTIRKWYACAEGIVLLQGAADRMEKGHQAMSQRITE